MVLILATETRITNNTPICKLHFILNNHLVYQDFYIQEEHSINDMLTQFYTYVYYHKSSFLFDCKNNIVNVNLNDYRTILYKEKVKSIKEILQKSQQYGKLDTIEQMFKG